MRSLCLAVPKTFSTWMPAPVAKAFACALARLSAAGVVIVELDMIEFAESLDIRALGMGIAAQAHALVR